jgi:putative salt-induced outer membrane protein YdiY
MIGNLVEGRCQRVVLAMSVIATCPWAFVTASADEPAPPASSDPGEPAEDSLVVVKVQRAVQATKAQLNSEETMLTLPFADTSDWILTGTGEWLRGRVDWMRNDIMEFDSDEFGPLEVHMRDVAGIHAPHVDTYVFDDRSSLRGRAIITADRIVVETEAGVENRPRDTLWAIVEGGGRELDYWSTMLDIGLSANRGNSNQVDFNLGWRIVREDKRTLTELAYGLNMGKADGEQTVSRHIAAFLNQVWVSELFFVQPIVGQLLSDRFQDIRFRAQPAVAAGVRFLDTPNVWWNVSTGPGYQYLKLYDPFVGVDDSQHDGLVRFATRARFDMTSDIVLTVHWMTNLTYTAVGNTNHTGTAELLIEVTNTFNFDVSFLYLRTEEPPPRANGTFPVKNDYRLIFGIALQLG